MIVTTWVNGIDKDLQSNNGLIVRKHPALTEAYARIITPRGSYLVDKDFGSLLFEDFNGRGVPTNRTVIEKISDALLPMKNQGRVLKFVTKVIYPVMATSVTFSVRLYTLDDLELELLDTYRN